MWVDEREDKMQGKWCEMYEEVGIQNTDFNSLQALSPHLICNTIYLLPFPSHSPWEIQTMKSLTTSNKNYLILSVMISCAVSFLVFIEAKYMEVPTHHLQSSTFNHIETCLHRIAQNPPTYTTRRFVIIYENIILWWTCLCKNEQFQDFQDLSRSMVSSDRLRLYYGCCWEHYFDCLGHCYC